MRGPNVNGFASQWNIGFSVWRVTHCCKKSDIFILVLSALIGNLFRDTLSVKQTYVEESLCLFINHIRW